MGCIPMKRIATLFIALAAIAFAGAPLLVQATQISPNPNPDGSTIDIINDPFAQNTANPFVNAGTIAVDSLSTLTNSGTLINNGTSINSGTLTNTGTLNNTGFIANSTTGTLTNNGLLINSGRLSTSLGSTINNGVMTNSGFMFGGFTNTGVLNQTGEVSLVGGSGITNSGVLTNSGNVRWDNTVTNTGVLTNSGTLHGSDGILNNSGTVTNAAGALLSFSQGALINAGVLNNFGTLFVTRFFDNSGTLTNAGLLTAVAVGHTYTNSGTFLNTGTMTSDNIGGIITTLTNSGTVINSGTLTGTGNYLQTAGQTINNGSLSQTSIAIQGGLLSGTGAITGNVTIGSGATVSPGNSLGTLTINGNLSSSGSMLFQIGGPISGQYDILHINGSAGFAGGNITFDFINGFVASAGNSWDFLYASAITGWDTLTFTVNGLRPGQTYAFNYANGVETLTIRQAHNVPEPDSFLLLAVSLAGLAWWRRKQHAH